MSDKRIMRPDQQLACIGWLREDDDEEQSFELLAAFSNTSDQVPQEYFYLIVDMALTLYKAEHPDAIVIERQEMIDVIDLIEDERV